MTIHLSTEKGQIKIVSTFRVSRALKKKIKDSIRSAMEDVKPVGPLLQKLKKQDPLIGTARGSLMAHMTAKSWTQIDLAQKTGISQGDISKMLNGKRPMGLIVAKKLARAFGVDYRKFL